MNKIERESLGHVLAAVRENAELAGDVQTLLPLLAPRPRKPRGIVPRDDQTHIAF